MTRPHKCYSNQVLLRQPADIPLPTTHLRASATKKRNPPPRSSNTKKHAPDVLLPEDFDPSDHTVIIGRGRRVRESAGNRRLRALAASLLPLYVEAADADNRAAKTRLVNEVVDLVKRVDSSFSSCEESDDECCDDRPLFVRKSKDDGRWYEVDDVVAREKVGYVFRDLLSDRYESSSKSKVAKKMQLQRRQEREELERRRREEQQQLEAEEEQIMIEALLELTLPSVAVPGRATKLDDDIYPITPVSDARAVYAFEDELLNSPIIECLPIEP